MRQLPMGKLADLWAELATLEKLEDKERVQKKINGIEQWCIDNKFGNFKELTDWTKPCSGSAMMIHTRSKSEKQKRGTN